MPTARSCSPTPAPTWSRWRRPDGDPFRDEAALFAVLHTSKRSATFDPARGDDRDALDRLVARRRHRGGRSSPRGPTPGSAATSRSCGGSSRSWSWCRSRGSAAPVRGPIAPPPSSPCRPGAVRSPVAAASTSRRSPPGAASANGSRDRSVASPHWPRCTARAGVVRAHSSTCRRSRP